MPPASVASQTSSSIRETDPLTEPAAQTSWDVEVIDGDDIVSMRDEWNELLSRSRSNCFFLTWDWLECWSRHICEDETCVVTVRRDGELAGLAPLIGTAEGLVDHLELMGTGTVGSDYLDLIADADHEDEVIDRLASWLIEDGRPLTLEQVPATGSLIERLLERLAEEHGWHRETQIANVCPYIDLAGRSWDDYLGSLSSSHRYNFRRRTRQLEKEFDVELELVDTELTRRRALDTLIELHLDRWSDRGGSDAFPRQAVGDFHHEVSRRALDRDWLRLFVLRLDGQPAAALYGFLYEQRFLFYQSGFDADFGKYSVGLVTMGMSIRHAIEAGATEYDLLHGDESYKSSWASDRRHISRMCGYPSSVAGSLLRSRRQLVARSKDVARTLLPDAVVAAIAAGRSR